MFFQIVGSVALAAFLGYLAWQIQRVSERIETLSDSLNARMDTITIDLGEVKGQVKVVLQRLDENDKAHAENDKAHDALAQRIEELAVAIQKR